MLIEEVRIEEPSDFLCPGVNHWLRVPRKQPNKNQPVVVRIGPAPTLVGYGLTDRKDDGLCGRGAAVGKGKEGIRGDPVGNSTILHPGQ